MKILISILVLALLSITDSLTAQDSSVTATILNVTSDEGSVIFALFIKHNFMRESIQGKTGVIIDGKSTVIFENVNAGEYAVICYHDKNDNNKMDFQPNGMPLEDYGASNNIMNFGPPKYEDAKFTVTDKKVSLKIKF